jgi:signal peptidase
MRIVRHFASGLIVLAILGMAGTAITLHGLGYRMYVIHTGSMSPTYRPGDVVIDRPGHGPYRAGQVITFLHSDAARDVVTHRITDVTPAGLIHTKGDANRTGDVWDIRANQVQGRTIAGVPGLGYLLIFLKQPTGALSLACAVLCCLLLWTIFFPSTAREVPVGRHAVGRTRVDSF